MIISASGHRPQKIGGFIIPNPTYNSICKQTKELLLKLKPEKCIMGGALGYDQYFATVCIELKIPFIAAIPFIGQESLWPEESKKKYREILDFAEEIIIVSTGTYASWKLQKRNEYMVDACDEAMVCYDRKSDGGTKNFIEYANKKRKSIRYIDVK